MSLISSGAFQLRKLGSAAEVDGGGAESVPPPKADAGGFAGAMEQIRSGKVQLRRVGSAAHQCQGKTPPSSPAPAAANPMALMRAELASKISNRLKILEQHENDDDDDDMDDDW